MIPDGNLSLIWGFLKDEKSILSDKNLTKKHFAHHRKKNTNLHQKQRHLLCDRQKNWPISAFIWNITFHNWNIQSYSIFPFWNQRI